MLQRTDEKECGDSRPALPSMAADRPSPHCLHYIDVTAGRTSRVLAVARSIATTGGL